MILDVAAKAVEGPIYVAGPMTGIVDHNFPAFLAVTSTLRDMGYRVVSPAELDEGGSLTEPWDYYLRRDLKELANCQTIAVLPGWQEPRGAALHVRGGRRRGTGLGDADRVPPSPTCQAHGKGP